MQFGGNTVDPNGQKGFSLKGFVSSVRSAPARVASTVKSIARAVSPRATVSRIISSGSKVAANIKAGASKVTAKVQQSINKSIKTVKNLANPKTIRQKTRAAVSGAKATMSSIKKMVSGGISKAEKFTGAQKLALLSAAKTAKGNMVKYTKLGANQVTSVVKQGVKTAVDYGKYQKGNVLKLFDSGKTKAKAAARVARDVGLGAMYEYGNTGLVGAPEMITKTAERQVNNKAFQAGRMVGALAGMVQGAQTFVAGVGITGGSEALGIAATPVSFGSSLALAQAVAPAGVAVAGLGAAQTIKGVHGFFDAGDRLFAKGERISKDIDYNRPSGFRKGVRDQVWEKAKGPDGKVKDPLTGKVIDKNKPWDMGHKPGREFHKFQKSAQKRGLSRKELLDEYNNPDNYRPELPSSNRSHKAEDMINQYFGP